MEDIFVTSGKVGEQVIQEKKLVQQVQLHVIKVTTFNLTMSVFHLLDKRSAPVTSIKSYRLEVTKDADVGKLLSVSVRVQRQEERPFEGEEAPHAGQVQAPGVSDSCGTRQTRGLIPAGQSSPTVCYVLSFYKLNRKDWITLLRCDGQT